MKKLVAFACSAAVLNLYSLAFAQNQEVASVKYNPSKEVVVEKAKDSSPAKNEAVTETLKIPVESQSLDQIRSTYEMRKSKDSNLNNKVGPNGEDIFLEGKTYYYIDDSGKKVKVNNSSLKDKPKHS